MLLTSISEYCYFSQVQFVGKQSFSPYPCILTCSKGHGVLNLGRLTFHTQQQSDSQITAVLEITQDIPPLCTVYSPQSYFFLIQGFKVSQCGGQNVMYHNWNADGFKLCFSHHSLLTHGLACQASQRKLSQYTSEFCEPTCCPKV